VISSKPTSGQSGLSRSTSGLPRYIRESKRGFFLDFKRQLNSSANSKFSSMPSICEREPYLKTSVPRLRIDLNVAAMFPYNPLHRIEA
jgi:hypothetical protein